MTVATYTCGVGDGLALGECLGVLIALAPAVEEDVVAACSSAQVIVRADSGLRHRGMRSHTGAGLRGGDTGAEQKPHMPRAAAQRAVGTCSRAACFLTVVGLDEPIPLGEIFDVKDHASRHCCTHAGRIHPVLCVSHLLRTDLARRCTLKWPTWR